MTKPHSEHAGPGMLKDVPFPGDEDSPEPVRKAPSVSLVTREDRAAYMDLFDDIGSDMARIAEKWPPTMQPGADTVQSACATLTIRADRRIGR